MTTLDQETLDAYRLASTLAATLIRESSAPYLAMMAATDILVQVAVYVEAHAPVHGKAEERDEVVTGAFKRLIAARREAIRLARTVMKPQ